jgi:hypothetical protein
VYSFAVDDVETPRNRIVAGLQTICEEFGIVFGWQGNVELRPVFGQEVDIWNIYCKVM